MTLGIVPVRRDKDCLGCGRPFRSDDPRKVRCRDSCGRKRPAQSVRFVGVDGEGLGADPSVYVLLGVGEHQIENKDGLQFEEIAEFLYSRYEAEGRGACFIGFFLGYDFTQWFKSLPENRARILLTKEGIRSRKHRVPGKEPHPVTYGSWQFDVLGSKRFRLRPHTCGCRISTCTHKHKSWMYVCDVGPFWQTSFLNVIDPKEWIKPVVSEQEYEEIKRGKERRSLAILDDEMRHYNKLENVALVRAMEALESGFQKMGVHLSPRQWFGPGQAAGAWLKDKAPKKEELKECVPDWFAEAARRSYFGGWFEIFMHGHIPGVTYEYDINSAYPNVIKRLPCLLHGAYYRSSDTDLPPLGNSGLVPELGDRDLLFVYATVRASGFNVRGNRQGRHYTGPMPHRSTDGSVSRPAITRGWFSYGELLASVRSGLCGKIRKGDIVEWVMYRPCDCPPPFRDVENLYTLRLESGKSSPLGKGAKLVYNAGYGKFAQSEGNPPFGNAIYAALITSSCREMILDAIGTHPKKAQAVAMVATDAVFFTEPHPGLPVSKKLGEWDYKAREGLTLFKPGVYWDDETRRQIAAAARGEAGSKIKFKARGVNASQFAEVIWNIDFQFSHLSELGRTPHGMVRWPDVVFNSTFSMVTCLQALMWNDWKLAGKVRDVQLVQNSDPSSKRGLPFWDAESQVWRTDIRRPIYSFEKEDWDCDSVPYRKMFGTDDPFSDESREEAGLTPDGLVGDMFRRILKNDE